MDFYFGFILVTENEYPGMDSIFGYPVSVGGVFHKLQNDIFKSISSPVNAAWLIKNKSQVYSAWSCKIQLNNVKKPSSSQELHQGVHLCSVSCSLIVIEKAYKYNLLEIFVNVDQSNSTTPWNVLTGFWAIIYFSGEQEICFSTHRYNPF